MLVTVEELVIIPYPPKTSILSKDVPFKMGRHLKIRFKHLICSTKNL